MLENYWGKIFYQFLIKDTFYDWFAVQWFTLDIKSN